MLKNIQTIPEVITLQDIPKILYAAVRQNTSESFSVCDGNFKIVWTNHYETGNPIMGKTCYEAYFNRNSPCPDPNCVVKNIFNIGQVCTNEKCLHLRDGKQAWKEVRAYPIFDNQGDLIYALNISHDITAQRAALDRQKRYVQYLEQSLQEVSRKQDNPDSDARNFANQVSLTGRELEVLRLMAAGFTNNEIAGILGVSRHTIKSHVVKVFSKLGVNDRTQAAVQATRLKLVR